MPPADVISKTVPGQRLLEQQLRRLPSGAGYGLALLSAFLLHGAVLSVVYFENWFGSSPPTNPAEIPIEIVAEPPAQPPPPQPKPDTAETKPDPSPPTPPIDNEIATDAPREASKEKIERKATDESTKTPPAPKETAQANPGGSAGNASTEPPQQGEPNATESSSAPDLNKPDAEIVRSAVESGLQKAEQASRALAQGQPQLAGSEIFPAWSIGQQASNFEHMLDSELGGGAQETPVAGGNAKKTYLTILYGMIMPHMRAPPNVHPGASKIEGVLTFAIDGRGNLVDRRIRRSSGFPDLDSAALAAVAAATPFPAPPQGQPIRLTFTYGAAN